MVRDMQSFGQDVLTMNGDDVRMYGMLPFTTRMTVVRLKSGGLWLHSPVRPTPERRRAVDQRHPDIAVDAVLTNDVEAPWSGEIDHCVIEGHAVLDEVEFLHRPSMSLIITDLIQKHEAAAIDQRGRR